MKTLTYIRALGFRPLGWWARLGWHRGGAGDCAALRHNYGCFVTGPHFEPAGHPGERARQVVARGQRTNGSSANLYQRTTAILVVFVLAQVGLALMFRHPVGQTAGGNPAADAAQVPVAEQKPTGAEAAFPLLQSAVRKDLGGAGEATTPAVPASCPVNEGMRVSWFPTIGAAGMPLMQAFMDEDGEFINAPH